VSRWRRHSFLWEAHGRLLTHRTGSSVEVIAFHSSVIGAAVQPNVQPLPPTIVGRYNNEVETIRFAIVPSSILGPQCPQQPYNRLCLSDPPGHVCPIHRSRALCIGLERPRASPLARWCLVAESKCDELARRLIGCLTASELIPTVVPMASFVAKSVVRSGSSSDRDHPRQMP
jgi:hypothetical protein